MREVAEVVGFAVMGLAVLAACLGLGQWLGQQYDRANEREPEA